MFNYDIILPETFVPQPVDGEVEYFVLWSIDEIYNAMSPNTTNPMKPNCYLVIIDFLVRYGYVTPDTPGYLDLQREIRNYRTCQ